MKRVLVSATSITSGGALNILKQFILNADPTHEYHLVLNSQLQLPVECLNKSNFTYNYVNERSRLDRVIWDFWGANRYIKNTGIKFNTLISLQNTTLRAGKLPQVVYLHQGLTLHPQKWSFLKRTERSYAFYKYIYPLFIFAFVNPKTHFVVQTEWMRNTLIKKFRVNKDKVSNIKPDIVPWSKPDKTLERDTNHLYLLYPASSEIFKNHLLLLQSLEKIEQSGIDISRFKITFTLSESNHAVSHISSYLARHPKISDCIDFAGQMSYESLKKYYDQADIILFPSKIESFGLPLLEGAMLGKKVMCLDTDFAQEVLKGYKGATFIKNEPSAWALKLQEALNEGTHQYRPFTPSYNTGWDSFFKLI